MVEEREPEGQDVHELLDEWRKAEKDVEGEKPGGAARKMARKRANHAREDFHEAEDEERERQGDHRPRHPDTEPPESG